MKPGYRSACLVTVLLLAITSFFSVYAQPISSDDTALNLTSYNNHSIAGKVSLVSQVGGEISALAVNDLHVFLGVGSFLVVLDVSSPAMPMVVGALDLHSSLISSIAIAGGYSYITTLDTGLRIINIDDPTDPYEVGFFDQSTGYQAVAVAGKFAYVIDSVSSDTNSLRIVNIANPAKSFQAGSLLIPNDNSSFARIVLSGIYAYIVDGSSGLRIIDVSNPSKPKDVGSFSGYFQDVAVKGKYVYLTDIYAMGGLSVINANNPRDPIEAGYYDIPGGAHDILVAGDFAYVANENGGSGGLRILNIANPTKPSEVSFLAAPGDSYGLEVLADTAYVIGSHGDLHLVDMTKRRFPKEIGLYRSFRALDIDTSGKYAYVPAGQKGLHILNIANPASPYGVGIYETPGYGNAVDVSAKGKFAYVADSSYGLRIIKIADPLNPIQVGSLAIAGGADGVVVAGDYAYVIDEGAGKLRIVKVSTPSNPSEVSFIDNPVSGVAVDGNYAYITTEFSFTNSWDPGLYIFNISDPTSPRLDGYYEIPPARTTSLAVSGDRAYLAVCQCAEPGCQAVPEELRIIDIANPSSPKEIGVYNLGACFDDIEVKGDIAYTTNAFKAKGGVRILNISNPKKLIEAGAYQTTMAARGLDVSGEYIYLALGWDGLLTLHYGEAIYLPLVIR